MNSVHQNWSTAVLGDAGGSGSTMSKLSCVVTCDMITPQLFLPYCICTYSRTILITGVYCPFNRDWC